MYENVQQGHCSSFMLSYCRVPPIRLRFVEARVVDADRNKKELRGLLRQRRNELAAGESGAMRALRLQKRLLSDPLWERSRRVVLYVAVKGEAGTSLLLDEAWRSGRTVFLPRCRPEEPGIMDMLVCRGPEELEVSRFGIPEPRMSAGARRLSGEELCAGEKTLLVVPALAFDREGFRLGYGGGYYDRLLATARCASVGLAFHDLLLDRLPRDGWDRPVGAVCTEEELICL